MVAELSGVSGIEAVVLGGSRARGTHREDSDFDLGLYYRSDALDASALEAVAARWADHAVPLALPGAWGPWVNGGAWLRIDDTPVDWILRDLDRVAEQCERARRGEFAFHPQPGHPLGFLDVSYAGEVATCVPLVDEAGVLAELAGRVSDYPAPLRRAMLDNLWQVDFLLDAAAKGARLADAAYVSLCLSHAAMLVAHAWHAVAGVWVTNEKGLVPQVDRLAIDSRGFSGVVAEAFDAMGRTPEELTASIAVLRRAPRPE